MSRPLNNKKDERYWAVRISELMPKEEFSEFSLFLDGCDSVEFSACVAEIDATKYPQKYIDPKHWDTVKEIQRKIKVKK